MIIKSNTKLFLLDQHDGNAEQQRESDISKSVDHIELLCQDQVRKFLDSIFKKNRNLHIFRFWIYQWIYERLNILCGKEVAILFYVFVQNLNSLFDCIIVLTFDFVFCILISPIIVKFLLVLNRTSH